MQKKQAVAPPPGATPWDTVGSVTQPAWSPVGHTTGPTDTPTWPVVGPTGGANPPPVPPTPPVPGNADVTTLSTDLIGDIPPPPVPPPPIVGSGVAGIPGTEAGTFARPGTRGAIPFRTSAFRPRPPRFGPGVPQAGGGTTDVSGLGGNDLGLSPEQAAELLRQLVAGRAGGGQ
jgi:hypothetical protein